MIKNGNVLYVRFKLRWSARRYQISWETAPYRNNNIMMTYIILLLLLSHSYEHVFKTQQ